MPRKVGESGKAGESVKFALRMVLIANSRHLLITLTK